MATIELNRQFLEWGDGQLADPDLIEAFGLVDRRLGWTDLLSRRRVVILAEAGSGKSEELKEQARLGKAGGKFCFYATVQDVGRDGLAAAVDPAQKEQLAVWTASDELAWFFIDSIDEAKLNRVSLETALRRLAHGIHGAESRAHILLSGRHTDWEFRRDLKRLNDVLPLRLDQPAPKAPTSDELLVSTIRNERVENGKPPEQALVVVMAALDPDRVRLFAKGKGVPDVDSLMAAIDAANAWRFSRRPLDLDWLVRFWRTNKRLGSLVEMLDATARERLSEPDPSRARAGKVEFARSLGAVERIGAALAFGRQATIAIPDSEIVLAEKDRGLHITEILPDWAGEDRAILLSQPMFDPATFGRARLHNDNEGVVRSYLTARWLRRLSEVNLSRLQLFNLLFADTYGVKLGPRLIKPTIR